MTVSQFMEDVEKTMLNLDWHDLAAQKASRLTPYVETKLFSGADMNYDRMGDAATEKANGYGEEIKGSTIPVSTRQLTSGRYYSAVEVDQRQVRRIMMDAGGDGGVAATGFANRLATKCAEALERRKDRILLEAAFADVKTGENFDTTVSFATDGGVTITATSGITYSTVLSIIASFQAYEVSNEANPRIVWAMTEEEMQDLMTISELISNTFITTANKSGDRLTSISGIDLVVFGSSVTNPALAVASNVRSTMVLAEGGLCLGVSKNISVEYDKLPKTLETYLLKVYYDYGAVRTEGVRVQKVNTAAS
jgi:hypothetical protein